MTRAEVIAARRERCDRANALIRAVGSVGRRFWWSEKHQRFARIELDDRGRCWWHDDHSGKRLYGHSGRWFGYWFSHGGTLNQLAQALVKFVHAGEPVYWRFFGPDPPWLCGGDVWGYGLDALEWVRGEAERLGVIDPPDAERAMWAERCRHGWTAADLEPVPVEELGEPVG